MAGESTESSLEISSGSIKYPRCKTGEIKYSDRRPKNGMGRSVFVLQGIPSVNYQDSERFLSQLAQAGLGRGVIAVERPEGRYSHGEHYGASILNVLQSLIKLEQEKEKPEGIHVMGHSMGAAEAIEIVYAIMKNAKDIEEVRRCIASLIVINSAGLTRNSWLGHMIRFLQTWLATFRLPQQEKEVQREWIKSCNDPRKILQRQQEVGYIAELSRGQIVQMLLEIQKAGIPVLALQSGGDTLIPCRLLHPEIRHIVQVMESKENHLGIYSRIPEEVIAHLDRLDRPDLTGSIPNALYPEATR